MLSVVVVSFTHLLLPLAWLLVLAWRVPQSGLVRVANLLASALLVAFFVYAGTVWAVLGWYTRWALLALAAPLWLRAATRLRGVALRPRGVGSWASGLVALALLLLGADGWWALLPERGATPAAVEVSSPLAAGTYLVIQGGGAVQNHHAAVLAQHHALDIVALNDGGRRASGLAPEELSRYAIYARPVLAPCTGEVLVARDGLEDLPVGPPGAAGERTPLGNTLLIHCTSDITVVLAHLKPGSVRVAAGDTVTAGHVIAAVGNSGNTTEPHLHLHAVRGRVSDPRRALSDAEPVLLSIQGQIPVRNERLELTEVPGAGASS